MNHSDLITIAHHWLLSKGCGFVFTELKALVDNGEIPDAIGFKGPSTSLLVECKATRADFLSDRAKRFRRIPSRGMGSFRWYMAPQGIITQTDLPPGWGLITVSPDGKARQVFGPSGNTFPPSSPFHHKVKSTRSELQMMYSALRRLHIRNLIQTIYDPPLPNRRRK